MRKQAHNCERTTTKLATFHRNKREEEDEEDDEEEEEEEKVSNCVKFTVIPHTGRRLPRLS